MTTTEQRQNLSSLIWQACKNGARLHNACKQIGITCRTLQRWLSSSCQPLSNVSAPESAQQQHEPQASIEAVPTLARALDVAPDKPVGADRRQTGLRQAVTPHNKLTAQECEDVLAVLNSDEFKDLPPSQIVPRLAPLSQNSCRLQKLRMIRVKATQHETKQLLWRIQRTGTAQST